MDGRAGDFKRTHGDERIPHPLNPDDRNPAAVFVLFPRVVHIQGCFQFRNGSQDNRCGAPITNAIRFAAHNHVRPQVEGARVVGGVARIVTPRVD